MTMSTVNFIAVSHFDLRWAARFLIVGALFSLIGIVNRFVRRNQSKEERVKSNNSYGGLRIYWLGIAGIPLIIIGIILLIAGAV